MEEQLRNQLISLGELIGQCTLIAKDFYKNASPENLELLSDEELIEIYGHLIVTEKKVREFMDVMNLKNL